LDLATPVAHSENLLDRLQSQLEHANTISSNVNLKESVVSKKVLEGEKVSPALATQSKI
jgi:hypothetical protein